jgi:hypothetical protein
MHVIVVLRVVILGGEKKPITPVEVMKVVTSVD